MLTGRKLKLSPRQQRELLAWAEYATSKVGAARRLGVSMTTLARYLSFGNKGQAHAKRRAA